VTLPERVKEAALLLKVLYDEDLAEEEVVLAWAGKEDAGAILGLSGEAAAPVRKAAAPFVDWLQEADEDEEEDEEDEE
jgi:translation initiation factor 5